MIFNIVFFISLTSLLLQGTTLLKAAKWLHVGLPEKVRPFAPTEVFLSEHPKTIMKEIEISNDSSAVGKRIVDLAFPKSGFIAMIKRNEKYLTPSGTTIIEANDILIVLSSSEEGINKVIECLSIIN